MPMPRCALLSLTASVTLAALVGLPGCKKNGSGPHVAADTATSQIDPSDYIALYNARRYAQARTAAEAALPRLKDREREIAGLTAGLSAHASGDLSGAQKLLTPLTASKDDQISGRAEAALGQIAQSQGKTGYAADLLARAAKKLDGDNAARAGLRAGNAYTAAGQQSQAMNQYKNAANDASSDALKKAATTMTEPGPFSLQAGVFNSRANADTKARQLRSLSMSAGFGPPRVVPDVVKGKVVYAVKMGMFPSRPAATTAKSRLGNQQVVVVNAN
jgi:tetratricopeptide (TPR) repeat protein